MNRKKWIIFASIFICVLCLDLWSKWFFANHQNFNVIPNILSFYYVENKGAAFSMLSGKTVFLIIFSITLSISFLVYFIFSKNKTALFSVSISLIIAGAVGNLIDRMFLHYVRDFILLDFLKYPVFSFNPFRVSFESFPIFNVADLALTVGIILFIIVVIKSGAKEKNGK